VSEEERKRESAQSGEEGRVGLGWAGCVCVCVWWPPAVSGCVRVEGKRCRVADVGAD
jgi:hypothetical protein